MSKCWTCKEPVKEGAIRCDECVKEGKVSIPLVQYVGVGFTRRDK